MNRGFYTVMAAQFFSSLADNALLIAAIALLVELHGPAWMTPLLKFFFTVSYVVLAAFVGAFADSLPKGKVMFVTNTVKMAGCALMFFYDAFAMLGELGHETVGAFLEDLRARRHRQDQVAAIGTRALAALTRSAIAGATVRLPAVGLEIAFVTIADQDDVAALAAVTAVGSALRDEFLTTEADAAVAAVTGLQFNLGFVDKHFPYGRGSPAPRARRKGDRLTLQPAGTAQPALDRREEDEVRQQADAHHHEHHAHDLVHSLQVTSSVQQGTQAKSIDNHHEDLGRHERTPGESPALLESADDAG